MSSDWTSAAAPVRSQSEGAFDVASLGAEPVLAVHDEDRKELDRLFRLESQDARRGDVRTGLWVAVTVYMMFAVTDVLLIPDVAVAAILSRAAIGLAVLAVLEFQVRKNVSADSLDRICAAAIVLGYIGWLIPCLASENIAYVPYYMVFGSIFMMGANLFFTFHFRLSLATSAVILSLIYFANVFVPSTTTFKLVLALFYFTCFVFTSYINWKLNRERYNVFLNAYEARKQHGEATERGKALLRLSRTDPLTGLDNRRAVDERLRDHWSNWQQSGKAFATILIDVDFFKKFNDCYGHQEGDLCLTLVGEALRKTAYARGASIGRYGGEEFLVLAELSTHDEVLELAEAMRKTVEGLSLGHEQRRDGTMIVTASVGAAFTRSQPGGRLERVIQEADRALYLAKASGRNCAKVFDPNDPQTSDEIENIAALLKIAIRDELVSLVYQPIHHLQTGRMDGVEALMRLRMPDGTNVPPSLFIPIAERTGIIIELGRWAIATVCRELLVDDHVRTVSVNVSPIQLQTPGFAVSVAQVLAEVGVPGNRFAFEITEGLDMEMNAETLRCINDLKRLGIKIWLDDFGTGFAGLSWVRQVDFHTVKIDRSFLDDSGTSRGKDMLKDIVVLLRNRGPRILVEGVESEDHMVLMRDLQIDQVQGYYLGRPAPAETYWPDAVPRKYGAELVRVA